jgi:hypothetical protein
VSFRSSYRCVEFVIGLSVRWVSLILDEIVGGRRQYL